MNNNESKVIIKINTMRSIFIGMFFFLIFSCSNNQTIENKSDSVSSAKIQPPIVIKATSPNVILLEKNSLPLVIKLPTSNGVLVKQTKNGPKKILLKPTETKPSGFYSFMQKYNTDQGLALSSVSCGFKDRIGNLWFGTQGGGVSKYDGKSFTNFSTTQGLVNNTIFSIIEDKTGNFWFATQGGVSRYDGKNFKNYTTANGLSNNRIFSILEDKNGLLWFATNGGGINMFDGKTFKQYTTENSNLSSMSFNKIIEDSKGNLWFGTSNAGVTKYDGKNFTNINTLAGLAGNNVFSIAEDKKGNIWFGTLGNGLSKYNGKTFTNYSTLEGLGSNDIFSITQDSVGGLWFGTNGGGVSKLIEAAILGGEQKQYFLNYTTNQGLANNHVASITEDNSGNLWFGTLGDGISRYDGKSFTGYATEQGLSNNVVFSAIEDKKGCLWFSTIGGGVSKYDGLSFTNFTESQGLPTNTVRSSILDKDGNIWFGTNREGVCKYDGKSFTTYTEDQGLANNTILSIAQDKKGNLWFGTYGGGVSKFDGQSFTNYKMQQGLANDFVRAIVEDKNGNLWFGTFGGGVSKFNGKSFTNYTTLHGLANNMVYSIHEDKYGDLWFGTDGGGVSKLNTHVSNSDNLFTNYSTADGLSNDVVLAIVEDKPNDLLWFGTNEGLSGLKLSSQKNKKESPVKFENYNNKTGYPIKDINTNSLLIDSKGIIWAGTGDKLVRFDYNGLHKSLKPQNVFIQSLKINNTTISWYDLKTATSQKQITNITDSTIIPANVIEEVNVFGRTLTESERVEMQQKFKNIQFDSVSRFYSVPENLIIPYELNKVTFDFVAIEPAKNSLVRYQYILEGYDNDWSPITDKPTATFGNISEGSYTFKIKAQSPDGFWGEPVLYTFKVLPPWYRTWWAYGTYLIIAFAVFYSFFRWRMASLRKDKEVLEQTVFERTAEVVMQKDEAEFQRKDADKQRNLVEEKNKNIIDSINYAKRIQDALLKEGEQIDKHLPEHFILYKPKDIISGDFYWSLEKQGHLYLAVADCTGHGVPGAMMSMLGIAFLNEITSTEKLLTPAEILDKLRERIIKELSQTGKEGDSKDGMDISISRLNLSNKELQWSGANNSLYIISSEIKEYKNEEVREIKPNKQPIGYHSKMHPFTNHTIQLEPGVGFFLFTDGFADQFGGPKGKKYMYSKFKETLILLQQQPMVKQKQLLNDKFESWKGDLEQLDDVCVVGMRV